MEPGRQNRVPGDATVIACAIDQTATTDCPAESRDTSSPGFGAILDSAPLVPAKSPTSSRSSSPGASANAFPMFRCAASRLRDCPDTTNPGRVHQIGGGCLVITYGYGCSSAPKLRLGAEYVGRIARSAVRHGVSRGGEYLGHPALWVGCAGCVADRRSALPGESALPGGGYPRTCGSTTCLYPRPRCTRTIPNPARNVSSPMPSGRP